MFYKRFLDLCNKEGKSPSRVALEIGASKPAVTRWKGGSVPSDARIAKLADYFGVSVEYLKGLNSEEMLENEKKNDTRLDVIRKMETNSDYKEAILHLLDLDDEKIRAVNQMLNTLYK